MKNTKDDVIRAANIYTKHTGLPMIIWVDDVGSGYSDKTITPRIYVQNILGDDGTDDVFTMSISKTPEIIDGKCKLHKENVELVKTFIINNYDNLMNQWNGKIDEYELKNLLIKIK